MRRHLPDAPIIIMADGVRPEQAEYEERYQQYLRDLATLAPKWKPILLSLFTEFQHQAAMTRETLKQVKTPLILFQEHDTMFIEQQTDGSRCPIDFPGICRVVRSGALHVVGFHCHWEPWILRGHEHMMLDVKRHYIDGVPFVRTWQFSARPHVASTDFYRMLLNGYFTKDCRTFIEDRIYDVIASSRKTLGEEGWHLWKLAYYAPHGSIRRTWTDNGRAGDKKFESVY